MAGFMHEGDEEPDGVGNDGGIDDVSLGNDAAVLLHDQLFHIRHIPKKQRNNKRQDRDEDGLAPQCLLLADLRPRAYRPLVAPNEEQRHQRNRQPTQNKYQRQGEIRRQLHIQDRS